MGLLDLCMVLDLCMMLVLSMGMVELMTAGMGLGICSCCSNRQLPLLLLLQGCGSCSAIPATAVAARPCSCRQQRGQGCSADGVPAGCSACRCLSHIAHQGIS